MRTFTANFDTVRSRTHLKPYFVMEVEWSSGTKYYIDRDTTEFSATGTRIPTGAETRISEWPTIVIQLRENQVNSVDTLTISLWDADKAVKALIDADIQQRRAVRVWMLYDDPLTVWPTDAALLMNGSTKPFSFRESSQSLTFQVEDSSARLIQQVGKVADNTTFPQVPAEHRDRTLPIIYGSPRRVEMICVDRPWSTVALENVASDVVGTTFDVLDHPDDIGVAHGPSNPVWVVLGDDECRGYFTQSATPSTVASTFTIDQQDWITLGHGRLEWISSDGLEIRVLKSSIRPHTFDWSQVQVSDPLRIIQANTLTRHSRTISRLRNGDPGPDWVRIKLDTALPLIQNGRVEFVDAMTERRPWPAGTTLRERDNSYTYVANLFPSEAVQFVEGYGAVIHEGGDVNKQMTVCPPSEYEVDLDDATWSVSLGHNVTTVKVYDEPRHFWPWLDDNRLWATVRGTKADGGSFTRNPAKIIEHILTDSHMMNIASTEIDAASFAAAESQWSTEGVEISYPITDVRTGLEVAQELAAQVHAVLQFAGGAVGGGSSIKILILQNSPPVTSQSIDETIVEQRTLKFQDEPLERLASHVLGHWRRDWDDKSPDNVLRVGARNANVLSSFGRNVRQIQLKAFSERDAAQDEVDWWAERWEWLHRFWEIRVFHSALNLLPGDYVDFTYTDAESNVLVSGETGMLVTAAALQPDGMVRLILKQRKHDYS
jgi:hypothetical protein